MIFFSGCKINLGLHILDKRPDNYHNLETMMYPIEGLCDAVEIIKGRHPGVEFSMSGLAVEVAPGKNLCEKAYELMRRSYPIGGVKIHLHKVIPMGAGLGGGSANAAYVIKGLSELFELGLSVPTMESLAAQIGSDTAFFIANRPALATGRGEILKPYNLSLKGYKLVIVKPDVSVSTAEAYSKVIPSHPVVSLAEQLHLPVEMWRDRLTNDFEESVFALYPQLHVIKQRLYDAGALYASMSGSGAALFGLFLGDTPVDETAFSDLFVYQEDMA